MTTLRKKVVVAMSGGVDSSVAACLLVEQGYDVVGLFMRVGAAEPPPSQAHAEDVATCSAKPGGRERQGCCSAADAGDARFVAGKLGIPFFSLNFQRDFDKIIDYFADEYARGRTPNPCVVCNDRLKFGRLVDYADAIGADSIATGHYARLITARGQRTLARAIDQRKDQSYVLFGLKRDILDRVLFPIGHLVKSEVRRIARERGLPNHDKPDSVEICFAPNRDYARVVRERRPDAFAAGDVIDQAGKVLGRHGGIARYTIGQRRGLGIAAGKPIYVTELSVAGNTVTMGDADALLRESLTAERVSYLVDMPAGPFRAQVKIRYLHAPTAATVHPEGKSAVRVVFDEPQRAVTPGQAVVFYDKDLVIGGGWIEKAYVREAEAEHVRDRQADEAVAGVRAGADVES